MSSEVELSVGWIYHLPDTQWVFESGDVGIRITGIETRSLAWDIAELAGYCLVDVGDDTYEDLWCLWKHPDYEPG